MPFLSAIPLRAWLIAGALGAIGFLVWREHVAIAARKAEHARAEQLESTLKAERANRQKEHEVYAKIDQQRIAAEKALDAERNKPLPHLACRLRVPAPNVQSSDTAARVDNGSTEGHHSGEDATDSVGEFDPTGDLLSFAVDSQANRDELLLCQEFVREVSAPAAH